MNTRQQDIVTITEKHGEVTIKQLARELGVSEMTIHRDLDLLQEQNYVCKKRGAAVFIESSDRDKRGFYQREKRMIGKMAATMVKPGQTIIFDNSTTVMECARFLDKPMGLTLYTTNIETATILSKCPGHIMYCSGGYYFPDSRGFVGSQTESFISSVHADLCIVGTSGISLEGGITTPYPMHTSLQKKIMQSSERCIMLADHSKFGKTAAEKVAELSDVDVIVTDEGISDKALEDFGRYVNIIVARG